MSASPVSPSDARSGVLQVLVAAALFGTTGTAAAFAPAGTSSIAIGAARLVIGGLALILVLPLLGGRRRNLLALWRSPLGIIAGVMTAVSQASFFVAVSLAGVALGTLVTAGSVPILVGLFSWIALGERPTRTWWASTAVCIGGLGLLTLAGSQQPSVNLAGLLLALVAGAGYAAYTVAAKRIIRSGAHCSEAMAAAFGLAGLLLLPALVVAGPGWLLTPNGAAVGLWMGLVATTFGYTLFGRGLRVLPAGPVGTLGLAEPLVATMLGVLVLHESLGQAGWTGAALVAAGLGLEAIVSIRSRTVSNPKPLAEEVAFA